MLYKTLMLGPVDEVSMVSWDCGEGTGLWLVIVVVLFIKVLF